MQEPSLRRSHESSSGSLHQRDRSTTSGQFQTDHVSDNNEETGGISLVADFGKDQMRILQTALVKNSHPPQGAFSIFMTSEKTIEWDISTLRSTNRVENSVRPCGQKPSADSNERTRSRQTAPGMDLKTVGATQFGHEAWTLRVKNIQHNKLAPTWNARKPHGVPMTGGHSASSNEQHMVGKRERLRLQIGRVVGRSSVACADDSMVLATSQKPWNKESWTSRKGSEKEAWRWGMQKQTGPQHTSCETRG